MNIEWKSILLVLGIIFAMLLIIKTIDKKFKLKGELKRKLFHMSMGLTMLILPYIFTSIISVAILAGIALITMYILKHTNLKNSLGKVIYDVERESLGEVFFTISVFAIFYLSKGNKILYSIPILILTFADSTAALIGKSYGKNTVSQYNEDAKSIEGSFMFFMVAFMATLVPLLLYTEVGREETLIISLIVGFNVALIEMISHTGNDNLLIPLTTFAFLSIHIGHDVQMLRTHLVILGTIFLLVTIANRIKALSKLAIVEALVVGYLSAILYGGYALIPPFMLLATVMRFPKETEAEKNNKYDARIIETNIIIPTAICGLVAITGWRKEFFLIYATAYTMHLVVNSFVRFKYYIKMKEIDSLLLAISKGIGFIFIPCMIVQKWIFKEFINYGMLISMIIAVLLSGIMIYLKKKNINEDEISIQNGYKQMKIVLVLTIILVANELIQII